MKNSQIVEIQTFQWKSVSVLGKTFKFKWQWNFVWSCEF